MLKVLKGASAIQFYVLIAMAVIGFLGSDLFLYFDGDWALLFVFGLSLIGATGISLLPFYFLGLIGLFFRGSSNPIQYVFAIVCPPIVAMTCVPYTVKTPLGAVWSAIIGNFGCIFPLWGNFRAWTLLNRNQRRKEREEAADLNAEALAKVLKNKD